VEFLAGLAGDGRVLELAIGTGRVALPLAARGITVEGVDASAAMIERLRAKPAGDSIPVTGRSSCPFGVAESVVTSMNDWRDRLRQTRLRRRIVTASQRMPYMSAICLRRKLICWSRPA
jgi:predicted TPR repeat methyltransferase